MATSTIRPSASIGGNAAITANNNVTITYAICTLIDGKGTNYLVMFSVSEALPTGTSLFTLPYQANIDDGYYFYLSNSNTDRLTRTKSSGIKTAAQLNAGSYVAVFPY